MSLKNLIKAERVPYILFFGVLLIRFWGIGKGLPIPDTDEPVLVRRALRFATGDFNPHYFLYPSLSLYLYFILSGLYYAFAWVLGFYHTTHDFALAFVQNPTPIYLLCRASAAVADAGSVVLFFLMGARCRKPWLALIASLPWIFSSTVMGMAQTTKPDTLMVFLSMLALYFMWSAEKPLQRAALGGFLVGLSFSAKYFALPAGAVIFIYLLLDEAPWKERLISIMRFSFFFAFGFVLGTPYSLLDFKAFIHDTFQLTDLYLQGSPAEVTSSQRSFQYYGRLLLSGERILLTLFLFLNFIYFILKRNRWMTSLFIGLLAAFTMLGVQRIGADHYFLIGDALMIVSFLSVLINWDSMFPEFRKIAFVLALILVSPMVVKGAKSFPEFRNKTLKQQIFEWTIKNVPVGSKILIDSWITDLPVSREQLQKVYENAKRINHIKADLFQLQLEAHRGGGYDVFLIKDPVMPTAKDMVEYVRKVQMLIDVSVGYDDVKAEGVRYVMVTEGARENLKQNYPSYVKFFNDLKLRGKELVRFSGPESRTMIVYSVE